MRPTTLRLLLLNDAAAWRRLAATVAGIGLGVALLFTLLGAHAGLDVRDARTWWMNLNVQPATDDSGTPVPLTDDNALVAGHIEVFRDAPIWQLDVAVTPGSRVQLPGGLDTPAVGQSLVSPALASLIAAVPRDQLGDRFGTLAGELPASMLTGPDSLVTIHMTTEATLRDRDHVWVVEDFTGVQPDTNGVYSMMLVIGAIALIIPVVLLVSIVTQLGAAQRRERLQTLRLIGATPGIVAAMAAVEMAVMTVLGSLAGLGLFYIARPLAAQVSVNGTRFYPTDLTVDPWTALTVAVLVVAASTATAVWRVNREGIGPLGVTRQRSESVPRVSRLLPLLGGAVLIAVGASLPQEVVDFRQYLAIGGFALVAIGIISAGPWLVHRISGTLGRRTNSAAAVVAAGWFRRHPAAAFRSVAGLVVALFMVTVFAGMASVATIGLRLVEIPGLMPPDTARAHLAPGADAAQLREAFGQVDGVTRVVVGYATSPEDPDARGPVISAADALALGIPGMPGDGCVTFVDFFYDDPRATEAAPASAIRCSAGGEAVVVFVVTDGTTSAMERSQTLAATSPALSSSLATRLDGVNKANVGAVETLATMAYLGVLIAVIIAGVSLAVSSAGAVIDNRRTFSLMRLMGMPPTVLRRVVATQALVPLLATIGATIATGFAVAWALITGWASRVTMSWPDPRYYLAIAGATALAAVAVMASFPVVTNTTRSQATRFE